MRLQYPNGNKHLVYRYEHGQKIAWLVYNPPKNQKWLHRRDGSLSSVHEFKNQKRKFYRFSKTLRLCTTARARSALRLSRGGSAARTALVMDNIVVAQKMKPWIPQGGLASPLSPLQKKIFKN